MKVLMIFDQTQSGLGGKESADLALGGKMMPIGSCNMFEKQVRLLELYIVEMEHL